MKVVILLKMLSVILFFVSVVRAGFDEIAATKELI